MGASAPNNRSILLMIAGIPVMVLLASTWLWYYVSSGQLDLVSILGTANQGTLVQPPREISTLRLRDSSGAQLTLPAAEDPKWTLLIPALAGCDEPCRQLVYYTRQIRTAMGKYTHRIDRVLLGMDAVPDLDEALLAEHPGLKVVYTPAPDWTRLMQGAARAEDRPAYYLVDPAGWVMMYYLAADDGKDVMADLKFLIKNSEG